MDGRSRAALGLGFAVAMLAAGALAGDIGTFNRAVRAGDFSTAAAQTAHIWADIHKGSQRAATMAREFGFIHYLAGQYEQADSYASQLLEDVRLSRRDEQPAVSLVLERMIAFRLAPGRRSRAALLDALSEREAEPGLDTISIVAAELLYDADWQASRWADARRTAELAERLLSRAGRSFAGSRWKARLTAVAAGFMRRPRPPAHREMIAIHDDLLDELRESDDPSASAALEPLRWQAAAWVYAIAAWYQTYYVQAGIDAGISIRHQVLDLSTVPANDTTAPTAVCPGRVDLPPVRLPDPMAARGKVGAAILRLSVDEHGAVHDAAVLAAAPAADLAEVAVNAAPGFQWVAGGEARDEGCTLASIVVPVVFVLEGGQGWAVIPR